MCLRQFRKQLQQWHRGFVMPMNCAVSALHMGGIFAMTATAAPPPPPPPPHNKTSSYTPALAEFKCLCIAQTGIQLKGQAIIFCLENLAVTQPKQAQAQICFSTLITGPQELITQHKRNFLRVSHMYSSWRTV